MVYVDGIPIESTVLDAGDSGLKGEEKSDPAALAALDPRAVRLLPRFIRDGGRIVNALADVRMVFFPC